MNRLVVSDTYMDSYDNMSKQQRKIIRNAIKQFSRGDKGNNFQIHKLNREDCDPTFWSARINHNIRLIFSHQRDRYVLLYIGNHDDAYNWAKHKYLHKNPFNAVYVYDESVELKYIESEDKQNLNYNVKGVLESLAISKKDLRKLGLTEKFSEILLKCSDDETYLQLIEVLPDEMQEVLFELFTGDITITQAYSILNDETSSNEDIFNNNSSRNRFYVVEDEEDLDRILDVNFERWKLFLHPSQREIVMKNFKGPVLIEGGPGTGKTVVGLHRAIHLAKEVYKKSNDNNILFCTYSKKLATYIGDKLLQLIRLSGIESNISVNGIDSLVYDLMKKYDIDISFVNKKEINNLFKVIYEYINPDKSIEFCYVEYKEVIQKYNIKTEEDYLRFNRQGMGQSLNPSSRRKLWIFFKAFINVKKERNLLDYEDRVWLLYELVKKGIIKPMYDSIIIDEAQDLSIAKMKLITSLIRTKENNLMILSDQNQRIFQLNSWRKDMNLDVVGRTYYLSLNYRTSKQIKEYAEKQFIRTEMIKKHITNYKSLFGGPEPQTELFDSYGEQYLWITEKIKSLIESGLSPYEIGIVVNTESKELVNFLNDFGIETVILKGEIYPNMINDKVSVTTLHGCKGLEFRAIIIADAQNLYVQREESKDLEEWYHKKRQQQLECLKYVACTRAREYLVITAID